MPSAASRRHARSSPCPKIEGISTQVRPAQPIKWENMDSDHFVVISGCSSGGKSTLLAELGRRGHAMVEEPGRRIVRQELVDGGSALPWVAGAAFARRSRLSRRMGVL